jgi:hypothetical protein
MLRVQSPNILCLITALVWISFFDSLLSAYQLNKRAAFREYLLQANIRDGFGFPDVA